MRPRILLHILLALVAGPLLGNAPAMAAKDKLKVVTTFTVIADMAQNVAGDYAQVVSITKPGAEIHEYQPTPQDIVRGSDADLIL
ncbi:MAG TPA: zinc ABC transporter substrate-binding protein, partial [Salinisphaeraceae bacterium]|nr:zinc ABC transporter substrate-binding protein [Salinisphaeraceae bacterium]